MIRGRMIQHPQREWFPQWRWLSALRALVNS
jgi:hypothetical protein